MERSEPSLVPEWLKNSGSATGGGTTPHSISSSVSYPDDHTLSKLGRNKSSVNVSESDLGRLPVSDRTSSSFFRRSSSSNGSSHLRSYSSFGRNRRGVNWDKDTYESRDKDKLLFSEHKLRDYVDPLDEIFPGRFEKDGLRRSQSMMISGKCGGVWPKRTPADSSSAARKNNTEGSGLLKKSSPVGSIQKAVFERDFPSLGSEEKQSSSEIGRVTSPGGKGSAIHGLPITSSTMIGGDKWISALAEAPALSESNGPGITSGQQSSFPNSSSLVLGTNTGLNMAETVAQGPIRAQTAPQSSTGAQRLEELAIKQSRQLIPVMPSMPKPLVLSSSDKVKTKFGQQQYPNSSALPNPSMRGGPVKTDVSKTITTGKLHVLKPVRERNGVTPAAKDGLSPTNSSKLTNSAVAVTPILSSTSRGSLNNSVSPSTERKHVLVLDKRPTSQAQSRHAFFNLVRKKAMANSSSAPDPIPGSGVSPSVLGKSDEPDSAPCPAAQLTDVAFLDSPNSFQPTDNKRNLTCNGDAFDEERYLKHGKNHLNSDPISSEEEEAAFLRSLGWEENADEDGGLTEEEISAFYRDVTKYMNSKPSLKILQGVQPRFSLPLGSQVATVGGVSAGLSSSNSKLES